VPQLLVPVPLSVDLLIEKFYFLLVAACLILERVKLDFCKTLAKTE